MDAKSMKLESYLEISLGSPAKQLRAMPVRLGKDSPAAILCVYSADIEVDPWCEAFFFPKDTLKLALFSAKGKRLWQRDLGPQVVPGAHFCPVTVFDLDGDGKDEIWFVNNSDIDHPLSLCGLRLERIDCQSGGTTGQWQWPCFAGDSQSMSFSYRNFIIGGYAGKKPVLVTAQGTYGPMFLQGWRPDMSMRWELRIGNTDPGARGSHRNPVIDLNEDGVDELLWGERCIELDKGKELFCADRDVYRGHSDVIAPFKNPADGRCYIFTCRESDSNAKPRVALFDASGKRIWGKIDQGHMDSGWVARIGENAKPVAMAVRIGNKRFTPEGIVYSEPEQFVFDAMTGEEYSLPFNAANTLPFDINGDGYDEIVRINDILDRFGNRIGSAPGEIAAVEKFSDFPGLQPLSYEADGTVRLWIDRNAE